VSEGGYVRRSLDRRSFSRVSTLDVPGPGVVASVVSLAPAFPNPARGALTLSFEAPAGAVGSITIFSAEGRLVRRLPVVGRGGAQRVGWDGRDEQGRRVAGGVYVARLSAAGAAETRRIVLLP
jgi:hypothetical protein